MSFESRDSLIVELDSAKEIARRTGRKDDWDYVKDVRYAIVDNDLDFELYTIDEVSEDQWTEASTIEAEGAAFILAKWICENKDSFYNDFDNTNIMNVYNDLSSERMDSKGKARWDFIENYYLTDDISVGGMVISGSVVFAEIWYDDAAVAYIPLN